MGIVVTLLGQFTVAVDGKAVADQAWSLRSRQLVALLALQPGRQLHREQVVDQLWPLLAPDAGVANLHKAAHLARRATGDADAVVLSGGMVRLWPRRADLEIDALAFADQARRALARHDPVAGRVALAHYGGGLLTEDPYEEWTQPHRQRLRSLYERLVQLDVTAAEPTLDADGSDAVDALIGRDTERAHLKAALQRAAEGTPSVVLLRGPAGIGKTALLRWLVARAAQAGWHTWRGTVEPAQAGMPYAALHPAIAQDAGLGDAADAGRALVQQVAGHGSDAADAAVPPPRHAVLGALQRLAVTQAQARGLAIAIDDAEALDDATIDLLRTLGHATGAALLIALAYRATTSERLRALTALFVAEGAIALDLAPLPRAQALGLVHAVSGATLSPRVAAEIVERAGGVPFQLQLLAQAAARGQPLTGALTRERLAARLSGGDVELGADLQRMACAGSVAAAHLADLLGDAQRAARVLATGAFELERGTYRWRHALLREAVLDGVPDPKRAQLQVAVAKRLQAAGAEPLTVARHWLAAGRGARALPLLIRAADRATALAAWADALAIVERALRQAPADAALHARRARLAFMTGDPGAALAFGKAASMAASSAARNDLRVGQAWAWLSVGNLEAAQQALAAVPTDAHGESAREATVRAMVACFAGELDTAAELAARARTQAQLAGDTQDVVNASFTAAMVAHTRGTLPALLQRELLASAGLPHLAGLAHDGYLCPAQNWLHSGEPLHRIAEFARRLRDAAKAAGAARGLAFATLLLGQAELLAGQVAAAAAELEQARELHVAVGAPGGEALALVTLAQHAVAARQRKRAAPLLAAATDAARRSPLTAWHLLPRIHGAWVMAASASQAATAIERALAELRGPEDRCPSCWVSFALPAALVAARAGRHDSATRLIDLTEPIVRSRWQRGTWVATLSEVRGHLAGSRSKAGAAFAAAAAEYQRCEQRLAANRCRAQAEALA